MVRWQITRKGEGFRDRHKITRRRVLAKLRRRLIRQDGPYRIHVDDHVGPQRNLRDTMAQVRKLAGDRAGLKIGVEPSSYDQPIWVIRSLEVRDPTPPMVEWCEQFVDRSGYQLGADGPPGLSDCSGMTRNAARAVHGVELPHGAALQFNDPHIDIFHDKDKLQGDDFVFFNYGRLNYPIPDHVELNIEGSRNIGSRPSTHGVDYYTMQSWDWDNIVGFGRLRG